MAVREAAGALRARPASCARPRSAARGLQFSRQFQTVQGVVPARFEPGAERAERLLAGAIEPAATVTSHGDQPGLGQHAQVLGDGAERDVTELPMELTSRAFLFPSEPEELAPARRVEGTQQGRHANSLVDTKLLSTAQGTPRAGPSSTQSFRVLAAAWRQTAGVLRAPPPGGKDERACALLRRIRAVASASGQPGIRRASRPRLGSERA